MVFCKPLAYTWIQYYIFQNYRYMCYHKWLVSYYTLHHGVLLQHEPPTHIINERRLLFQMMWLIQCPRINVAFIHPACQLNIFYGSVSVTQHTLYIFSHFNTCYSMYIHMVFWKPLAYTHVFRYNRGLTHFIQVYGVTILTCMFHVNLFTCYGQYMHIMVFCKPLSYTWIQVGL